MSGLDLKRIDELDLNDQLHVQELGRMVDEVYNSSQSYLRSLAAEWERNILFFIGDQHLYFNEGRNRYEVIPSTKYNKFIPRPVTNLILPIVQTMVSIWTRQKPNATVARNSTDPIDDMAAKLAERIQDAKWEMDNETINHIKAAIVLCLCGTVARKDYWDSTVGPEVNIPEIPMEGMEGIAEKMTGFSGKAGDNKVEIIDPFRLIKDLQTDYWIIEANVKPISWIKQQYGNQAPGYTGFAEKVIEDDGLSAVMELHQRLRMATTAGNYGSGKENAELKGCAVVKEGYIIPTQRHPNGIMVVRAGGQTLFAGDSPYFDPKCDSTDSWHPYTFSKYQELFFRWHGLPLVTNLVKLQERLNAIDALIALARKTTAIPQKLIPNGTKIPEGYWTGQPGLEIYYNPVGSNGARPEVLSPSSLSNDIWREREQVIESMHWIAGDNEVLSGLQPTGVDTVGQMQMLLEQSFSKFNPFIQAWEKFIEVGQTKKLRLIQKRYKEPRPDFVARIKEMNKENLDVEISSFIGADLRDNVAIKIEAGSSLPRSEIVQQETYKQLAQSGMFGPLDPIQNPLGNKEFLEKFGVQPLTTDLNADVKRARWVVSILTSINRGETPPEKYPKILPYDNKQIHLKILTDRMKHPEFIDQTNVFNQRMQELEMMIYQEQQQMMQQQMQQQSVLASHTPQQAPLSQKLGPERPEVLGVQ